MQMISIVLKTCGYYQWTEGKIEVLLTYAEADILDHNRQATAFSLLKVGGYVWLLVSHVCAGGGCSSGLLGAFPLGGHTVKWVCVVQREWDHFIHEYISVCVGVA